MITRKMRQEKIVIRSKRMTGEDDKMEEKKET